MTRVQRLKNILDPSPLQLGGLGERWKLPQWGLGRSPSRQRFWCILDWIEAAWCNLNGNNQQLSYFVETVSKSSPLPSLRSFSSPNVEKKSNIEILFHSSIQNLEHISYHLYFNIYTFRKHLNSELSTGHFSWTRPDQTKRWPDPQFPTKSLTPMCTMFQEFNIRVVNMEWYTIVVCFRGKYFSSSLVMFPEGEKTISYFSRLWSRGNKKTANIKC